MQQGEHTVVSRYIAEDLFALTSEEGPSAAGTTVEMAFQPPRKVWFP